MSFTHTQQRSITVSGRTITKSNDFTGSRIESLDENVADSATDDELAFNLDVSACKSFWIVSDQDVTVETNDGSTPDDTLNLLANKPYMWNEDSYDSFLLGTDVTALFVTNSSGASARIQAEALTDATP